MKAPTLFVLSVAASASYSQLTFTDVMAPNERAVQVLQAPGDGNTLFLVEQRGWGASTVARIRAFSRATGAVLGTVLTVPGMTPWQEGGLLGMAFHPEFSEPNSPHHRKFYVYVTAVQLNLTNATEVRQYRMDPVNPILADPNSMDIILTFLQPAPNHNGGTIRFGPDGYLYIGTGDGGGGGQPGLRAQDPAQPYGKMLRIDVDGDDFPSDPLRDYRIPSDNPLVNTPAAAPEVFARGLRNPWKWSFDLAANNGFNGLFIGDVGEGAREEVNYIRQGTSNQNFGWSDWEGRLYRPTMQPDPMPPGIDGPFLDYAHPLGVSVTGGVVYRGTDLGVDFWGRYVYADAFGRWLSWPKMTFDLETGALLTTVPTFSDLSNQPHVLDAGFITSIDPDHRGELWMTTYNAKAIRVGRAGGPSRSLTGTLTLGDATGPYLPKGVDLEIRMNSNPSDLISLQVGLSPSGSLRIPVPTGAGTISVDHGSWLRKTIAFDSSSTDVSGVVLQLINGDVDESGEVDAADIDEVIANFGLAIGDPGYLSDRNSDVDRSGEVDAADIDVVIANFGAVDD